MLNPRKKVTKKDLKQDRLVTTYFKASEYIAEKKRYLTWVIGGVVVLVVAGFIYVNNRTANNEKATTALGKILWYYDKGEYQTAIDGLPEKMIIGLKDIADNYGSTASGDLARFYLANAYFLTEKYDEALKYFEDFRGSYPSLRASALAGIAACYEVKQDYKKAAEYFEKAASKSADPQLTPEYLHHAARDYGLSGNKERAIKLLQRLKKDFPNSPYAREADRLLAQFSN